MNLNDMTEIQAKKILEYLAKRCGASALHIVKGTKNTCLYLTVVLPYTYRYRYVLYANNNWTNISIPHESQTPYLDFLKKFLELSSEGIKVDGLWMNNLHPFLKAGTCLEEILIEMDLAGKI
jgi:hypothetical protein